MVFLVYFEQAMLIFEIQRDVCVIKVRIAGLSYTSSIKYSFSPILRVHFLFSNYYIFFCTKFLCCPIMLLFYLKVVMLLIKITIDSFEKSWRVDKQIGTCKKGMVDSIMRLKGQPIKEFCCILIQSYDFITFPLCIVPLSVVSIGQGIILFGFSFLEI